MLMRPVPLPDELGAGYLGRFMLYNGIGEARTAVMMMMRSSSRQPHGSIGHSYCPARIVTLLAEMAGSETEDFVRDHTTLAMRCMREPALGTAWPNTSAAARNHINWSSAMRPTRIGAYFCAGCVHEDIDVHGMSFWRREQQLPGLYWCAKHDQTLRKVTAIDAFFNSPSRFIDDYEGVDKVWVGRVRRNPSVDRFSAISSALLSRKQPLDEGVISRVARARAIELGLITHASAVAVYQVSEFVRRRFDTEWLSLVVPETADSAHAAFCPQIDPAVSGHPSRLPLNSYALVFAALFEDSDSAITALLNSGQVAKAETPPKLVRFNPTDEEIRMAYIQCVGSHMEVAKRLGISLHTARRRLTEQGLPAQMSTRRSFPALKRRAFDVFNLGESSGGTSKDGGRTKVFQKKPAQGRM
jgi:hypothetical protein